MSAYFANSRRVGIRGELFHNELELSARLRRFRGMKEASVFVWHAAQFCQKMVDQTLAGTLAADSYDSLPA
jgi:hypothetical protein